MLKSTLPLLAAVSCLVLVACGGSGGGGGNSGSSATAGSTATTSTTAGASYVTTPARTDCVIVGLSPDGRFVGWVKPGSVQQPVYGASLGGSLQNLSSPAGQTNVLATAVNSAGGILGSSHNAGVGSDTPVFWSSYTATPKLLAMPAGVTNLAPADINKNNQIIARDTSNDDVYYYASPNATPSKVASSALTAMLSDTGAIVTENVPTSTVNVYPTPTAAPIRLKDPSGANVAEIRSIGPDGTIVGVRQISLYVTNACYWLPSDYSTAKYFKVPAGTESSVAPDVNASGQACGLYIDSSGKDHGCLWPSLTSNPVDLLSAGGSTVSEINVAWDLFNDGSMIAAKDTQSSIGEFYYLTPKAKNGQAPRLH